MLPVAAQGFPAVASCSTVVCKVNTYTVGPAVVDHYYYAQLFKQSESVYYYRDRGLMVMSGFRPRLDEGGGSPMGFQFG